MSETRYTRYPMADGRWPMYRVYLVSSIKINYYSKYWHLCIRLVDAAKKRHSRNSEKNNSVHLNTKHNSAINPNTYYMNWSAAFQWAYKQKNLAQTMREKKKRNSWINWKKNITDAPHISLNENLIIMKWRKKTTNKQSLRQRKKWSATKAAIKVKVKVYQAGSWTTDSSLFIQKHDYAIKQMI